MLYLGDSLKVLPTLRGYSVDLVFADPPYFLSNDGLSIRAGKVVSVNKGEWDNKENYESTSDFTYAWLKECYRVLKIGGTIWVTGTRHNIFEVEQEMGKIGFEIINVIVWHKTSPPPLIFKNRFRFSYEFIIWARKGQRHYFNYDLMFSLYKKEMEDVWHIAAVSNYEKRFGYHPTQKPEQLLRRIILAASKEGDVVLDPFLGSGTTAYVAKELKRNYIGIEQDEKYLNVAKLRLSSF